MSEKAILWQLWSTETFQKAKRLDKPVLLDISAVWCHWCHVMDQTTYANPEVAALIMENFVPIKADRDQRPDIDKRYNMGGWPTTAFLTPNGKIITGGTYIPPQQMKKLIPQVLEYYKKNKQKIEAEDEELEKKETTAEPQVQPVREEFQSVIDNITLVITGSFDQTYGGFGFAPKFPHSEALAFSLLEYRLLNHKALLNIVTKTLAKMQEGGIHDKVEGGFFRYSTTRDWSLPHYEKMCEDNAKLLTNYLQTLQVTGDNTFKATAQKIINYIDSNLSDRANGGFYSSQDADEEYYKLTSAEREKRAKPKVDKTLYTNYNAMMIPAYLLASTVLENPDCQKLAEKTTNLFLEKGFDHKEGMCHYILDGKRQFPTLLSDQAYMSKALIDVYQWTQERKYLNYAELIVKLTMQNLWSDKEGFVDRPVNTEDWGMLRTSYSPFDENAVLADALIRLHLLTGNEMYMDKAVATLNRLFQAYQRFEILGAFCALAVELYLHPVQVQIIGSREDTLTQQFVCEALRVYNPLKIIEVVDPAIDVERLKALKYPVEEKTTTYVCAGGKCTLAGNAADVAKLIE